MPPRRLEIGGGTLTILRRPRSSTGVARLQHLRRHRNDRHQVGSITANEEVTDLLGLTNTEVTVTDVTASATPHANTTADLPALGSVDDRLNLGGGIEHVNTAIPGCRTASDNDPDTSVTPSGRPSAWTRWWPAWMPCRALDPGCCASIRSRRGYRGSDVRGLRNRPAGFPGSVEVELHNQTSQVPQGPGMFGIDGPAR